MHLRNVTLAILVLATVAFSQTFPLTLAPEDGSYQVRYAANLNFGESYINIINDGYSGASVLGPGFPVPATNICVNVYAISPDEQLQACCSCLITPNGVVSLGVNTDVMVRPLTEFPRSVTLKILGSQPTPGASAATACNNSAAFVNNNNLVGGFIAFGTTLHIGPGGTTFGTETRFASASPSEGELSSLTYRCLNIIGNASGYGICGQPGLPSPCHTGAQ